MATDNVIKAATTKIVDAIQDTGAQVGRDANRAAQQVTNAAAQLSAAIGPPPPPGAGGGGLAGAVAGAANQMAAAVNVAAAFPLLTEDISYRSPIASPGNGGAGGSSQLGQMAMKAISDVLSWKPKKGDAKAFLGALNASFSCNEVEGHTVCVWTPRSYAVQTDIGGGITGAQASLYTRAKDAVDESFKLLPGLYALRSDADDEYIEATRDILSSQLNQLVVEMGVMGGPRVSRIDQIFFLLTGVMPPAQVIFDPDQLGVPPLPANAPFSAECQLATLRRVLGLRRQPLPAIPANPAGGFPFAVPAEPGNLVNTVEDETDQTNFRIVVDYITSLQQSWNANRQFFLVGQGAAAQAFFGTQLVLISQQLSVVAESVDEFRFALESVFIGPDEQQTVLINFGLTNAVVNVPNPPNPPIPIPINRLQPMFVDGLLSWIRAFATEEGSNVVQQGGTYGVALTFAPILLNSLIPAAAAMSDQNVVTGPGVPPAFLTPRIQNAANDLQDQLITLFGLVQQIQPPPF